MRKDWAACFGASRIHDIEVQTQGNTYGFVIRKPTRKVMEAVAQEGENNLAAANKIFISNCILAGDMQALEDAGEVYLAVLEHIGSLIQQKRVKVKKR